VGHGDLNDIAWNLKGLILLLRFILPKINPESLMQHTSIIHAPRGATSSHVHRYKPSRPWPVAGLAGAASAVAILFAWAVSTSLPDRVPVMVPIVSEYIRSVSAAKPAAATEPVKRQSQVNRIIL
jgi:hypothetical protein